jgi:hypothetical protein
MSKPRFKTETQINLMAVMLVQDLIDRGFGAREGLIAVTEALARLIAALPAEYRSETIENCGAHLESAVAQLARSAAKPFPEMATVQ